jgi:hypothetical protein
MYRSRTLPWVTLFVLVVGIGALVYFDVIRGDTSTVATAAVATTPSTAPAAAKAAPPPVALRDRSRCRDWESATPTQRQAYLRRSGWPTDYWTYVTASVGTLCPGTDVALRDLKDGVTSLIASGAGGKGGYLSDFREDPCALRSRFGLPPAKACRAGKATPLDPIQLARLGVVTSKSTCANWINAEQVPGGEKGTRNYLREIGWTDNLVDIGVQLYDDTCGNAVDRGAGGFVIGSSFVMCAVRLNGQGQQVVSLGEWKRLPEGRATC